MKRLPFNACDYRCERCLETAECAVYLQGQEYALQHHPYGGDGEEELSAVLDDLKESFRETKERIRVEAEEFGIDIDDIPADYSDEAERRHNASMNEPLFCRAADFTKQARDFLKRIDPLADGDARDYCEDIDWHHTIVSAKVFRAVSGGGNGYLEEDARNSAAVAIKSLTICGMAFEELGARFPDMSESCGKLCSMVLALKRDVRLRWLAGQ